MSHKFTKYNFSFILYCVLFFNITTYFLKTNINLQVCDVCDSKKLHICTICSRSSLSGKDSITSKSANLFVFQKCFKQVMKCSLMTLTTAIRLGKLLRKDLNVNGTKIITLQFVNDQVIITQIKKGFRGYSGLR